MPLRGNQCSKATFVRPKELTDGIHEQPDVKLGFVQPVGAAPKPATSQLTHEYAMGLFLLAGEEIFKLVESGRPTPSHTPTQVGGK